MEEGTKTFRDGDLKSISKKRNTSELASFAFFWDSVSSYAEHEPATFEWMVYNIFLLFVVIALGVDVRM